jgi:hypothetical protein
MGSKRRMTKQKIIRGIEQVERDVSEEATINEVKSRLASRCGHHKNAVTHALLAQIAKGVARIAREELENWRDHD